MQNQKVQLAKRWATVLSAGRNYAVIQEWNAESITIRLKTASGLSPWEEKITYLQEVIKLRNEAACCAVYWVLAKCITSNLKDEANVNKRRASVGLEPLEEYAKLFDINYVLPTPKKTN